jgi:uracil-DNA glycosylase
MSSLFSPHWNDIIDEVQVSDIIDKLTNYTPSRDKIFAFTSLHPTNVKVVIIGQDPYYTKDTAQGLAFSAPTITPSLRNIFACLLHNKLITEMPKSGDLTPWVQQGVLLLNASLTTEVGTANAHKTIWSDVTQRIIQRFDRPNIIFMLWGAYAQKICKVKNATVLTYAHPSPLAQSKQSFIHCDHFSQATEKLGICWELTTVTSLSTTPNIIASTLHTVVFTDGSCYPNNNSPESRGGYALYFPDKKIVYGSLDISKYTASNQRAEGYAIIRALQLTNGKIQIYTDSRFWIDMCQIYMKKWSENKFSTMKNSDLTKILYDLYSTRDVEFIHVYSHNKSKLKESKNALDQWKYENNDYVDKLAEHARKKMVPAHEKVKDL